VGFEPTISVGKRPQIHAIDRTATGTDVITLRHCIFRATEILVTRI
jgi:hypothetical protein